MRTLTPALVSLLALASLLALPGSLSTGAESRPSQGVDASARLDGGGDEEEDDDDDDDEEFRAVG